MGKSDKVITLSMIVLIGFVAAVFFHYFLGFYLGKAYPFNTFLMQPSIAFQDFTNLLPLIKGFAPYTPPATWQQYFPLAYLIMAPFAYFSDYMVSFFIYLSIFLGFFIYANIKFFKCKEFNKSQNFINVFIMTFLSYPVLFLVERGNFDMIIFIFFTAFVLLFGAKKYRAAAIFLGIINAMKPFSIIFLILFLFDKKYKEMFMSIITTFLLIIGGFLAFKGNIFDQVSVMFQSWILFKKQYIYDIGNWGMTNTSSLFSALKLIFCRYSTPPIIPTEILARYYSYLSMAVTVLIAFFTFREKLYWKKISLITLYMLLMPQSVYDYKLIFLFVPIYLFVNAQDKSKSDIIYALLFGLLLIPKHYYILDLMDNMNRLSISMFINPIIMILLITLIILEQFSVKGKKAK